MTKYLFFVLLLVGVGIVACTKDKVNPADNPPPISSACPDTISFANDVLPIIQSKCFSCHSGTSPVIQDYATINNNASIMLKAMRGDGAQLMPQGGPPLDTAFIQQFNCWIQQGKQNN